MANREVEIAIIGAGVAGIATAYYLCTKFKKQSVLLIDSRPPMSFTSAQSGDNYRNWWPHPTMAGFTNYSIDLMEQLALESSNVFGMTRRGYVLATRRPDVDNLLDELRACFSESEKNGIRFQSDSSSGSYEPPIAADWQNAADGVDVISNQKLIRETFPSFSEDIANVIHVRRAGSINGQQMGQYMLERIRDAGGQRVSGEVTGIEHNGKFMIDIDGSDGHQQITADIVVNAAGPFAKDVAAMLGTDLPMENVFQQKIAFDDELGAIPRDLPFSIDLDEQTLDWSSDEREMLAEDPQMAWLTRPIPGVTHCRPDGGDSGTWVKLGWAYNSEVSKPQQDLANEPLFNEQFPEIVLRGTAALNPALKQYSESFPTRWAHYGGYYPMTRENWPLIGPCGSSGSFVVGALSGFGSMSACAAGAIGAAWIAGGDLPDYATQLGLARYEDKKLMAELESVANKGIL
jgi:glycine/D-amino acid oxidase-like deaminating enzyme